MASAESAAFGASETFEQIAAHPSELLQCFRRVISASKIVFIASIDCVEWHMNVRYTFCTCPRYTARFCLILRSEPILSTVDAYTFTWRWDWFLLLSLGEVRLELGILLLSLGEVVLTALSFLSIVVLYLVVVVVVCLLLSVVLYPHQDVVDGDEHGYEQEESDNRKRVSQHHAR